MSLIHFKFGGSWPVTPDRKITSRLKRQEFLFAEEHIWLRKQQ